MPESVLISSARTLQVRRSGALADTRTVFGGNERRRRPKHVGSFSELRKFGETVLMLFSFTENGPGLPIFCYDNCSFISFSKQMRWFLKLPDQK
jgi:hypothetical protein